MLPKMSYKQVQKFGPCTGTEIRPNRSLSGQPCELARSVTFSVDIGPCVHTVNNTILLVIQLTAKYNDKVNCVNNT